MKATTLLKRIEAKLYTKKGTLAAKYHFIFDLLLNGKYYYNHYSGSGRFTTILTGGKIHAINSLHLLGIDWTLGNDAPRSGKIGDFIALTEKGKRQVAEWVKIRKAELAEEARIAAEKREAERRERAKREMLYKIECQKTYAEAGLKNVKVDLDAHGQRLLADKRKYNATYIVIITKKQCYEIAKKYGLKNNEGFRQYVNEYIEKNY